jgi:hypothetical protein
MGAKGDTGATGATGACDCQDLLDRIEALENELSKLEDFTYISDLVKLPATDPNLTGLETDVIQSGYTHNFWGAGSLEQTESLQNGRDYYLATSEQYPDLQKYQGDSTIGTLWIETPDGTMYTLPVKFDATGVHFTPTSTLNKLPAGTTFRFTQALLLTDPASS